MVIADNNILRKFRCLIKNIHVKRKICRNIKLYMSIYTYEYCSELYVYMPNIIPNDIILAECYNKHYQKIIIFKN